MSGRFEHAVHQGDIGLAASIMSFDSLSRRFHEHGETPNITDQRCLLWMMFFYVYTDLCIYM